MRAERNQPRPPNFADIAKLIAPIMRRGGCPHIWNGGRKALDAIDFMMSASRQKSRRASG